MDDRYSPFVDKATAKRLQSERREQVRAERAEAIRRNHPGRIIPISDYLGRVADRIRQRRESGEPAPVVDIPEGLPPCADCGGRRFLHDLSSGKAVRCPGCTTNDELRNARRNYSQMPEELRSLTFASFNAMWLPPQHPGHSELMAAYDDALAFARGDLSESWLVLVGSPARRSNLSDVDTPLYGTGTGKTHLAAAIVNGRSEQDGQPPALWCNAPQWLAELRQGFDDGSYDEHMEAVQNAACLVIDDLGSEYHKQGNGESWASEQLYRVLDYRYVRHFPTVITTNRPILELPYRIASRLLDTNNGMCAIHDLSNVPDYRLGIPKGRNNGNLHRRMNGGYR